MVVTSTEIMHNTHFVIGSHFRKRNYIFAVLPLNVSHPSKIALLVVSLLFCLCHLYIPRILSKQKQRETCWFIPVLITNVTMK